MDKAREAAVKIINEVHEKGAYANVALVQELRRQELSDVDRRFVTELVYGTVKAGATLDWILRRYVNRPVKKIPPMIADILRLGLYQLFFMDRIPASAACNEAVELAKRYGHPGTVKFVNAVLRTAVREPEKAAFPEGKGQATTQLALALGGLLREDVAFERLPALDRATGADPEALRSALLRLHLGHGVLSLSSNALPGGPPSANTSMTCSACAAPARYQVRRRFGSGIGSARG